MAIRHGFTLIELLVVIAIIAILAAILFPVFARARAKAQQNNCLSNIKELTLANLTYASDYDECFPWVWTTGGCAPAPAEMEWSGSIYPYVKSSQIFACPAGTTIPPVVPICPAGQGCYLSPADYRENACVGMSGAGPGCNNANSQFFPGCPGPALKLENVLNPPQMCMLYANNNASSYSYCANPDEGGLDYVGGDITVSSSYSPTYECPCIETRHNNGGNFSFMDGHASWLNMYIAYSWQQPWVKMWDNVP
jgi:prepilin-type N-terminal cleavage/methylation domain-containing protein/prepilin-type processing-associated H-X9-DG protein